MKKVEQEDNANSAPHNNWIEIRNEKKTQEY